MATPTWRLSAPKPRGAVYDEVQVREVVLRFPRDAEPGATIVFQRLRGGVPASEREPVRGAITAALLAALQTWIGSQARVAQLIDADAVASLTDPVAPPEPVAGSSTLGKLT